MKILVMLLLSFLQLGFAQTLFAQSQLSQSKYTQSQLSQPEFTQTPDVQSMIAQSEFSKPQFPPSELSQKMYSNPILHSDYSDPDVIRVGEDYWMTSSSFNCVPGMQILHSKDLVNWEIVGAALPRLTPEECFSFPAHGNGVWAPSIRYHEGRFYIFWGDPDHGIYFVSTDNPRSRWSDPKLIIPGKGMIDPCPLWDEDGRVYLVHAWAGSRAGFKSILTACELDPRCLEAPFSCNVPENNSKNHHISTLSDKKECPARNLPNRYPVNNSAMLSENVLVFDGKSTDNPTVEGPKFYKRDGWYYIFAPAGGVKEGWQLVLRSRNIYGPYEWRKVLHQGTTAIHGPHQGGWVEDTAGESWFLHFEDRYAYGRVVHLQPMTWNEDGWCTIGADPDGDGIGEPVLEYRRPSIAPLKIQSKHNPASSSEAHVNTDAVTPSTEKSKYNPASSSEAHANTDAVTSSTVKSKNNAVASSEVKRQKTIASAASTSRAASEALYSAVSDCNSAAALATVPDFRTAAIPLNWQWHANPSGAWALTCPAEGYLRLNCIKSPEGWKSLWDTPNLLLEKIVGPEMEFTTRIRFRPSYEGDRAGVVVLGEDYATIGLEYRGGKLLLTQSTCIGAPEGATEKVIAQIPLTFQDIHLLVKISPGAICTFFYSPDGRRYKPIGTPFTAKAGRWIGAKIGYYATAEIQKNDGGYVLVN